VARREEARVRALRFARETALGQDIPKEGRVDRKEPLDAQDLGARIGLDRRSEPLERRKESGRVGRDVERAMDWHELGEERATEGAMPHATAVEHRDPAGGGRRQDRDRPVDVRHGLDALAGTGPQAAGAAGPFRLEAGEHGGENDRLGQFAEFPIGATAQGKAEGRFGRRVGSFGRGREEFGHREPRGHPADPRG
jgi:hypothetical protein